MTLALAAGAPAATVGRAMTLLKKSHLINIKNNLRKGATHEFPLPLFTAVGAATVVGAATGAGDG